MSFLLVGDEIFPLKHWLMRPDAGKQATEKKFNFQLLRARTIIENTFNIKMEDLSEANRKYARKDPKMVPAKFALQIRLTMHTVLRQGSLIPRIVLLR